MGGSRGPRVHGPQPGRRGRPRPVRVVRLRREPQVAVIPKPDPAAEEPLPLEEVATPGATTIADARGVPGRRRRADGQGRVLRDRRRPAVTAIVRGDYEVNETKLVNAVKAIGGMRPAPGRGDQGRRDGARLRLADRCPRHGRRRRRPRRALAEPRGRRQPRGLPLPQRQRPAATSPRTSSPTSANAREGDPCPECGEPVILRNGIEVGNIFKLGTKYTRGARRRPTSARTASATRSSWARTASASGATSPASSRSITTRRASSGRPRSRRTRRTSWPSARTRSRAVTEIAERLHELAATPGRAARSCTTTATSRPA